MPAVLHYGVPVGLYLFRLSLNLDPIFDLVFLI